MLLELHAHQEAAVGSALDAEPAWAGELAGDQVLRHRGEVVIDQLTVGLQPRLVPGRPELAPAPDVGQHEGPPALQPKLADAGRVGGQHRNLEAAVGIEDGWVAGVVLQPLRSHDEVGDSGPIG